MNEIYALKCAHFFSQPTFCPRFGLFQTICQIINSGLVQIGILEWSQRLRGRSNQRVGKLWKVEDPKYFTDRPDVIGFATEPLEHDFEVIGQITDKIHASTSGTDSDWVVKLIDAYPETYAANQELGGCRLMMADDVWRGRFRKSR